MTPEELARQFYTLIAAQDFDRAGTLLSDDFEIEVRPKTMGVPVMNGAQYSGMLKATLGRMFAPGGMKLAIGEVYEAKTGGTVILRAESEGLSRLGTAWTNEYVFIVQTDGAKIKRITEFVDSAFSKAFFAEEGAKA